MRRILVVLAWLAGLGFVFATVIVAGIVALTLPARCAALNGTEVSMTPQPVPSASQPSVPQPSPTASSSFCDTDWTLPLAEGYTFNSPYGSRYHPIYHVWLFHNGVDLGAGYGKPIYAVHAGTITWRAGNGTLGNYVQIDHGGDVSTGYGHMSSFAAGQHVGSHVEAGDVVGYVGHTGAATGDHLHFLVKVDGHYVNPEAFMKKIGLPLR